MLAMPSVDQPKSPSPSSDRSSGAGQKSVKDMRDLVRADKQFSGLTLWVKGTALIGQTSGHVWSYRTYIHIPLIPCSWVHEALGGSSSQRSRGPTEATFVKNSQSGEILEESAGIHGEMNNFVTVPGYCSY